MFAGRILAAVAVASAVLCVAGPAGAAGSPITLAYADFSSTAGLVLTGTAVQRGAVVQLTDAVTNESGSVWAQRTIDATKSFSTDFTLDLHNSSGCIADGVAFVVQSSPNGPAAGASGGGLGYSGVSPSVEVEFDTYDDGYEPAGIESNHVAVMHAGNETDHLASADPGFPLYSPSSSPWHGWIDYAAATSTLRVYVSQSAAKPATPKIKYRIDVGAEVGSSAYVGFTGGTGACDSVQDVDAWHLTGRGVAHQTSTTVTASTATSVYGQPVSYTATVAAYDSGEPAPEGTVQFYDVQGGNQTALGAPVALTDGSAVLSDDAPLPAGEHDILAVYTSTNGLAASDGSVHEQVSAVATKTKLSPASGTALAYGSIITATVTGSPLSTVRPTGTVYFDDGVNQEPVALVRGKAIWRSLDLGTSDVSAQYVPDDANFLYSASRSATYTVTEGTLSSISMSSTKASAPHTAAVTITASLKHPTGTVVPTGTVTFTITGASSGSQPSRTVSVTSAGAAKVKLTGLTADTYTIVATYNGEDPHYAGLTGSPFTQTLT